MSNYNTAKVEAAFGNGQALVTILKKFESTNIIMMLSPLRGLGITSNQVTSCGEGAAFVIKRQATKYQAGLISISKIVAEFFAECFYNK